MIFFQSQNFENLMFEQLFSTQMIKNMTICVESKISIMFNIMVWTVMTCHVFLTTSEVFLAAEVIAIISELWSLENNSLEVTILNIGLIYLLIGRVFKRILTP